MIYYQNKQAGFSLVETLVAVSILLIVIVGPMSILMRTAKSSSFASENIQAFFLAQEGLELVQKMREDLTLNWFLPTGDINYVNNPWQRFSNPGGGYWLNCYSSNGCGLEWNNAYSAAFTAPILCSSSCRLYLSPTGRSRFTYSSTGTTLTPFTRRIYITTIDAKEVKVRSVVTWRTGSIAAEQSVEVETYLFNVYNSM